VTGLLSGEGPFGISDVAWATHLLALQETTHAAVTFVPASGVLGPLRAVKDAHELELLRRAARGADHAFNGISGMRLESLREEEVADRLDSLLRDAGHDEVLFVVVASGPNGASPHHEPSGRTIQGGEGVVMDFGGRVSRYCSDITRTVAVTRPTDELQHVYGVVAEAQEAAFRTVAPGVPAEEVDRAARQVIERAGYGERFVHRTGHGIGLELHEDPYIVAGNRTPLRPGMCFSIEPGIYLDGSLGVRIEDIVAVTEEGGDRLNHASRDLLTVA
jgi:Xaa-Pro aminopeptidase